MKVVIEIKNELKNGDLLIYENGSFKAIRIPKVLSSVYKENDALKGEIKDLKENLQSFKEQVNSKLKDMHEILQVITKGE